MRVRIGCYRTRSSPHGVGPVLTVGAVVALLLACQAPPSSTPAAGGPAQSNRAAAPAATAGPNSGGAPADWQQAWEALQAAAKQEGRLSVHGAPTPETRQGIVEAFRRRFGVEIAWDASRSNEVVAKMLTEKAAGTPLSFDVLLTGVLPDLYDNGILADLKAQWVLPDITDPTVWTLPEQVRYLDPEGRRVLRLINGPTAVLTVNREWVDPSSIRSIQDLLKPELKGKITGEDPTVAGSGGNTGASLYVQLGEEFVRKLYTEQLTSTRDVRQFADWVARGQYPIGLGVNVAQIDAMLQDGFPVEVIRTLPDYKSTTTGAYGVLYVVEGAQHPNAARLFANWIASREGLEIFSRTERYPATRKDINYAEWVPDYGIPEPGVAYMDTYNWEFKTKVQPETMAKIRDLLGAR